MNSKLLSVVLLALAMCWSVSSFAQEIEAETIVEGLNHPGSLAFHPVDGTIYVAEFGALRVIKIVDAKPIEVITGFDAHAFDGLGSDGGPVALEFFDANRLLVAATNEKERPIQVHGFDLTELKDDQPLLASDDHSTLGIGQDDSALLGQVNRMVSGSNSIMLIGQDDDKKAFVAKVAKTEELPSEMELLVPEKREDKKWLESTMAVTLSKPEGYLALVQNIAGGATLSFYNEEGEDNGSFNTGLKKVTAIAYGPERGRLFLADAENGAIYKLIESDNDAGCESLEVYKLANITDMRFNAAGELLVTTLGDQVGDDSGKVIKLVGLDSSKSEEKKTGE